MCSVNLEGWSGRDVPATVEGEQQAIQSMSMEDKFVLNMLEDPNIIQEARLEYQRAHPELRHVCELPEGTDALGGLYVKSALFELFQRSVKGNCYGNKSLKSSKSLFLGLRMIRQCRDFTESRKVAVVS